MAFVVELFPDRQLDFSIDPERLCDLLDQMDADNEIKIEYSTVDNNYPLICIADLPAILERLKFTLLPKKTSAGELLVSLFAPQPIRMEIVPRKSIQPYVTSSSSG